MSFMIFDTDGNVVAQYEDDFSARAAFHALAAFDPRTAEELALVEFDEHGTPVGEAHGVHETPLAVTLSAPAETLVWTSYLTFAANVSSVRKYVPQALMTWPAQRTESQPQDPVAA
ncbi:hypothetical protein [Gaiella sp.]|uniref:hypothetical protein n=1 Tax=Gaiella sp. TaxID=2663207 RepID=UPI002E35C7D8|nr:hypothetical protein [Gaiella sp.]HEX5584198.1 hypothetical protein [Gaiella sp.]